MKPEELITWREKQELTQLEAAKLLGISKRRLVNYEKGGTKIPKYFLFACKYLAIHLSTTKRVEIK
jgi:transcriptional regulator with XRE-family HTH domain